MNVEFTPLVQKKPPVRQIFNTVNKKPAYQDLPKVDNQKGHKQKINEVKNS